MGLQYLNKIASEDNIRRFVELADLVGGVGQSVDNVFALQQRLRHSKPMQLCVKRLNSDPASAALIAKRHQAPAYDAAALLAMPRGSLGHTFATVLGAINYDLNFFPDPSFWNNFESDADYVNYRIAATHDLHHVITGFSLDTFGELGVISVSVAQTSIPAFAFIDMITMLLSWLRSDTPIAEIPDPQHQVAELAYKYRTINKGLQMGHTAKPLFSVLWEERMEQNLEELRAELGIEPVREAPWSWEVDPIIRAALSS
jgi:ubiquinone biosynthesis protein COQ4